MQKLLFHRALNTTQRYYITKATILLSMGDGPVRRLRCGVPHKALFSTLKKKNLNLNLSLLYLCVCVCVFVSVHVSMYEYRLKCVMSHVSCVGEARVSVFTFHFEASWPERFWEFCVCLLAPCQGTGLTEACSHSWHEVRPGDSNSRRHACAAVALSTAQIPLQILMQEVLG